MGKKAEEEADARSGEGNIKEPEEEQAKITVAGMEFETTAKYSDTVKGFPFEADENHKMYHNEFIVTVKCIYPDGKKKRRSFKYYDSAQACMDGKTELSPKDLLYCFRCFIDDALAGVDTFEDFCGNLGFDTDSRKAERVHKACIKTLEKAEALGLATDDLYDALEVLSKGGIE